MYSEEDRNSNAEEPDWLKTEKEQFSRYRDKNKDGFMGKVNVKNRHCNIVHKPRLYRRTEQV